MMRKIVTVLTIAALLGAGTAKAEEKMFTERDLNAVYTVEESVTITLSGTQAHCSGDGVRTEDGRVTITRGGDYILTGAFQGMVIVDAGKEEKLRLVLDGADIGCETSAALYVRQAGKVVLTLADGSRNFLRSGDVFAAVDEHNVDAALFARDDLSINGGGTLTVSAPGGHGIVCKDDLVIAGGDITVMAAGHGLSANNSVRAAAGNLTVTAGKDGVKAEHEDAEKGFVYLEGGVWDISAAGDGVSASGSLRVLGGSCVIAAGGGSAAAAPRLQQPGDSSGSSGGRQAQPDTVSAKGMKAGGDMEIGGGVLEIDAADDALHSNANLTASGGLLTLRSGDDGMHADETLQIAGGCVNVLQSYEGLEGKQVLILGGNVAVCASDDGVNAAGGRDQSGFGGWGRDSFAEGGSAQIVISGGTLRVDAEGDGLDANGSLTVSGGAVYVNGPVNGGNGALDYDGQGIVTGGTVIAVGASGMAQGFSQGSTQGAILVNTGSQPEGSMIRLSDAEGRVLLEWQAEKRFSSVALSCPELAVGQRYTLAAGSYTQTIEMEDLIYGGHGGGFGGGRGPRGW